MKKIQRVKMQSQPSGAAIASRTSDNAPGYSASAEELAVAAFYTAGTTEMNLGDPDWTNIAEELVGIIPVKGFKMVSTI